MTFAGTYSMLGTLLRNFKSSKPSYYVNNKIIPILEMRKQRPREMNITDQWSQELNPGNVAPESTLLISVWSWAGFGVGMVWIRIQMANEYMIRDPLIIWEKFKPKTIFYLALTNNLKVEQCRAWVGTWGQRSSPVTLGASIDQCGHSRSDLAGLSPITQAWSLCPRKVTPGFSSQRNSHWSIGECLEGSPHSIVYSTGSRRQPNCCQENR